ncbi:hypothetical protein ACLBOM_09125 [Escherichia coli]
METNLPTPVICWISKIPCASRLPITWSRSYCRKWRMGDIPPEFLPLQSGVGNINNAVMARLGENPEIPPFMMYSEVLQESVVHLLETGKISGASASSLRILG